MADNFRRGDLLIYKKQKHGASPSPKARHIAPAVQAGEFAYVIDKYWVVTGVNDDGTLVARTRGGKSHQLNPKDHNLRRATWWQRLFYRSRFPKLAEVEQASRVA
jgi:hypothetical protein